MSAILSVTDLRKAYSGVHALDGVSFEVEAGSITGLIGPNGSGKSTAIDCISGFQKLDGGKVVLAGNDITGKVAAPHRARRPDAHLPDGADLRAAQRCATISRSPRSSSMRPPGSTSSSAPAAIATRSRRRRSARASWSS